MSDTHDESRIQTICLMIIAASAITDLSGNPFAGIGDDTMWNFSTMWQPRSVPGSPA